jgi:hypothetical protein
VLKPWAPYGATLIYPNLDLDLCSAVVTGAVADPLLWHASGTAHCP